MVSAIAADDVADLRMTAKPPLLFLSHSGADTEAARELKRRILAHPVATKSGLQVWFDKDDLAAGADWQAQIERALDACTAFAVYVGTLGVVNWVEREVRRGLERATGDSAIPFIPILALGAGWDEVAKLPLFARQHQSVIQPLLDSDQLDRLISSALGAARHESVPRLEEPFVGLRSMTEREADRFFGRKAELEELLADLRANSIVAIVADSGAGKSSLAMAGLVPAFRGGALEDRIARAPADKIWHPLVMRPGSDPVESLCRAVTEAATTMGRDGAACEALRERIRKHAGNPSELAYALRCDLPFERTETLLVVDQFDELFTETPEDKRSAFVDTLMALSRLPRPGGFRVVLTVRVDYVNLLRTYPALFGATVGAEAHGQMRLKRISDAGLEEAIVEPLRRAGVDDSDERNGLAKYTARDLSDRAGDLALAQMALYSVWRSRARYGGSLIKAYVDLGRVSGALAQEAERVRENLSEAERAMLTPLFVRLVRLGKTGGALRRVGAMAELDPARRHLATKLASDDHGRLLLIGEGHDHDQGSVEICHEALITQWPWLQNELNRDAADMRVLDKLMEKAESWQRASESKRPEFLSTGAELAAFEDLVDKKSEWLSETERRFIDDAVAAREEMLRRDFSQRRRLRVANWILSACVAGFFFAFLAIYYFYDHALQQTEEAQTQATQALGNQVVALAALARSQINQRPADALKLALAAWPRSENDPTPMRRVALDAIGEAMSQNRERRILTSDDQNYTLGPIIRVLEDSIIVNFQEKIEAFSVSDFRKIFLKEDSLLQRDRFLTSNLLIRHHRNQDIPFDIFDIKTNSVFRAPPAYFNTGVVYTIGDTNLLQIHSPDNGIFLWDVVTDRTLRLRNANPSASGHIAMPRSMDRLAVSFSDLSVEVYGYPDTGLQARLTFTDDPPAIGRAIPAAVFSNDGTRLAISSFGRRITIWNANLRSVERVLEGHTDMVMDIAFSPSGAQLVSSSRDGTARVWDVVSGQQIATLSGHTLTVNTATFSSDGHQILTASQDGTARVWDASTGLQIAVLRGHESNVSQALFSDDGRWIVTASSDRTVRLWDRPKWSPESIANLNRHMFFITHWPTNSDRLFRVAHDLNSFSVSSIIQPFSSIFSYDLRDKLPSRDLDGRESSLFISNSGSYIAYQTSLNDWQIWSLDDNRRIHLYIQSSNEPMLFFDFHENRGLIIFGTSSTVYVYGADSSSLLWTIKTNDSSFVAHSISPRSDRLALSKANGALIIVHLESMRIINEIRAFETQDNDVILSPIRLSPDGRFLAATGHGTLVVFNVEGGHVATPDYFLSTQVMELSGFDISSKFLFFSDSRGRLQQMDIATGVIQLVLNIDAALRFQPSSNLAYISLFNGTRMMVRLEPPSDGNSFDRACASLANHDLGPLVEEYRLGAMAPICRQRPPSPDPDSEEFRRPRAASQRIAN